jgi:hypothetical protein
MSKLEGPTYATLMLNLVLVHVSHNFRLHHAQPPSLDATAREQVRPIPPIPGMDGDD